MTLRYLVIVCLCVGPFVRAQLAEDVLPFQQDTLIVAYTPAPPFVMERNNELVGMNVWLWKRVASDLGIAYRFRPMGFSAMLDSLASGHIDVSINPLTITSERSRFMEFTHSFYPSNSTVAVAEVPGMQRFIQHIRGFLNINFLSGLFVLLLIIFLFGLLAWHFERHENPEHFRSDPKGIWDGFWWSAVTLTTVGYGDKAPRTKRGKTMALLLMFIGLLFISGLTASIASSLTVGQLNADPDHFEEFKPRTVGSIEKTGTLAFLRAHFFSDVREFTNVSEGLQALSDGEIEAFMYDEPILKYRIAKDSTLERLSLLPIKFDVQFYAFGIAKNRILLEQAVSQRILEIVESAEWQVVLREYGLTEF